MAYKAYVTSIKVSNHPDPEVHSIALGNANGNTVVISKKVKDGDLGLYFECDGQLSEEFAKANDLVRYTDPVTGEKKGGFFDLNRKVRAQKFRGVKSDGFWMPISSLSFIDGFDPNSLKEGDSFTEINGVAICNKFVTKATQKAASEKKKKDSIHKEEKLIITFPKHFDTDQFRNEARKFKAGDLISISMKAHGCVDRETIIETLEYGNITIGQVVDNKLFCHVKSFNHELGCITFEEISDFYYVPQTDNWYLIELEDGTKLEITGNNPVWLPELCCYRAIEDLDGDEILLVD